MPEPRRPARRARQKPGRLVEVADRLWVWYAGAGAASSAVVVAGTRGLLLVDTTGSAEQAAELVTALRDLPGSTTVVSTVLTHGHREHAGGLATLGAAWPQSEVVAHEQAGVPEATRTFSSVAVVDLGDRVAELAHPGAAHTAGDAVVLIPDAGVAAVGDLVAGAGVPDYGPDCHPLAWADSLDLVVGMLGPTSLAVPGHGHVLDRPAVEQQAADVAVVAETLRALASRSIPPQDALGSADWPFPVDALRHAVQRALPTRPGSPRRLPLV